MSMDIKPSHLRFLESVYAEIQHLPEGTKLMVLGTSPIHGGTFFLRESSLDNTWNFGVLRLADESITARIRQVPMQMSLMESPLAHSGEASVAPPQAQTPVEEPDDDEDQGELNVPPEKVKPN